MSVSAVSRGTWLWWLAGGWYGLLLLGGLMPDTPQTPGILDFAHSDKLIHCGMYMVWGLLLFLSGKLSNFWLLPACVLAWGQESTQWLVDTRSFEWLDGFADCAGILLGWIMAGKVRQLDVLVIREEA